MANISIPQQGQPIDYNYIYQIVETLNDISTKISTKYSESIVMDPTDRTSQTKRINDLSVGAYYLEITSDKKSKTKEDIAFTQSFNMTYSSVPIVTATPVVQSGKTGVNVSVILTKIEKDKVIGYVSLDEKTSGITTVGINIIAVGIPVL